MGKLKSFWNSVRSSLWFVPLLSVLLALALAFGLVELDSGMGFTLEDRYPRFFGVSANGARAMLSAIATSVITVAGVTFSITIVSLSLAATQYTSRVLRNFMRDRGNQLTLGTLIAIFVYCLIVLRTVRGGEHPFVPAISVAGAIVLAIFGIAMFIYFIHHIAATIEASTIVSDVAEQTIGAIDQLFPENVGEGAAHEEISEMPAALRNRKWLPVLARSSGFIQTIEPDSLLKCAVRLGAVIRMEWGVGDFVIRDTPLVSICEVDEVDPHLEKAINRLFGMQTYRSIEQDPAFGVRQIVDIALKALSPGVNDPTTAVICLQYLATILQALIHRRIPSRYRVSDGELRVIALGPTFEGLVDGMFSEIRQSSRDCVSVQVAMLEVIERTARQKLDPQRAAHLLEHARLVQQHAETFIKAPHDLPPIGEYFRRAAELLNVGQLGKGRK